MCKLALLEQGKYVADIKLNHIRNITEQAKKAKNIERIVLFGSSIGERCTKDSDIDIAVFGKKTKGKYIDSSEFNAFKSALFKFDWDQDYDVLYFSENMRSLAPIINDIDQGVEIFRRTAV